jgi:membrane-associated HD superfamily phosphohydrolase
MGNPLEKVCMVCYIHLSTHKIKRENEMLKQAKTQVAVTAPGYIESHEKESALRTAQYSLDRKLYDLRNKYHAEEVRLREEYLREVNEISNGGDAEE